jgi:hypothetical protein
MKITHDKVSVENFQPGAIYDVSLRGVKLYEAEVVKFHGGCWATVKVVRTHEAATAKYYSEGDTFDIKVAEYDVTPAEPPQSLS